LDVLVKAPVVETTQYDAVPTLDVSASYDIENQRGTIFLVNRSLKEPVVTDFIWQNGKTIQAGEGWQLTGSDPKESNSWDEPNRLVVNPVSTPTVIDGRALMQLPPLSFTAVTFRLG
jgi:alpha-N-arabinofuranosidase